MNSLPPLLYLNSIEEYKEYFYLHYCKEPVITFDGYQVRFRKERFTHDFYESSRKTGEKTFFSKKRSHRMNWIKITLQNPNSDLRYGWDKKNNKIDQKRRVAIIYHNYIVVINILDKEKKQAEFVTAFVADSISTYNKLLSMPKWQ